MADGEVLALQRLRAATMEIRADRERGASALAFVAAQAIADVTRLGVTMPGVRSMAVLAPAMYTLAQARPSMAAISNTVAAIWRQAAGSTPSGDDNWSSLSRLRDAAEAVVRRWHEAPGPILDVATPALQGTLLTFSRSGTVERVLQRLGGQRPGGRVVVLLSHPGDEGIALARSLAACGWRVTLIADAAASVQMERVAAVVVGADSVRADGALVNKIGTYPLALVARECQVPVYVLAETLKIAADDTPIGLEQMPAEEILPDAAVNIDVQNVYFDLTPDRLITALYTEEGALTKDAIRGRAEQAKQALHLLKSAAASGG